MVAHMWSPHMRVVAPLLLISCAPALHAALLQPWQRRRVVGTGLGALGAEAAGLFALPSPAAAAETAIEAAPATSILPPGTIETIEGRSRDDRQVHFAREFVHFPIVPDRPSNSI